MTNVERYREWSGVAPSRALQPGWELVPYVLDGKVAAITALSGTEIHFVVDPAVRGRLLTRRRIAGFLGPLLERKGFLTTRVLSAGHEAETKFVLRLGFAQTGGDGTYNHFMLSAIPFSRKEF